MTIAMQVQHRGRALRRLPLLAALALASAGALAGTPINERAAADATGQVNVDSWSNTLYDSLSTGKYKYPPSIKKGTVATRKS